MNVTITDEMIHAGERVMIRYVLAEQHGIKPDDVTDESIDAELVETRELEAQDPESPSLDDVVRLMLEAAMDASKPITPAADEWQAVLATWYGKVSDPDDFDHTHAPAASIWIVRRSAAPSGGSMPKNFDGADVAFQREGYGGDPEVRTRFAQAQAMAAGLNTAEIPR